MSIPITIHVDSGTDSHLLATRLADELRGKVDALELTLDGVTAITHHAVTDVKVGAAPKSK